MIIESHTDIGMEYKDLPSEYTTEIIKRIEREVVRGMLGRIDYGREYLVKMYTEYYEDPARYLYGYKSAISFDEIVRCKECKWAKPNTEGDYDCECHIPTFRVNADDFCSHGWRCKP